MNYTLSTLLRVGLTMLLHLLLVLQATAQREYFNWYFGDSAGISFVAPTPAPSVLQNGKVSFPQGAASMSNGAGQFLFASDGYTVWDKNWRSMPGRNVSQVLRWYGYNSRQVLALPQPGSNSRYYVFVSQREFYQNEYPVGINKSLFLPYVVVDATARNGVGGIVARDSVRLPGWTLHSKAPIYGLVCNWVAVRHANGQDLWLVGVTDEGQYVSWLLSAAGLSTIPIVSLAPRWIGSGGILKATTDGRKLALMVTASGQLGGRSYGRIELTQFDPATGQVTNAQVLPTYFKGYNWVFTSSGGGGVLPNLMGIEFSPDGSRLYADSAGAYPLQYNLLAGSPAAIDASRTPIKPVSTAALASRINDLKLGPDGKIYFNYSYNSNLVGCINAPNALGNACQLQSDQIKLQPRRNSIIGTLPLSPNDLNLPPVVVSSAGSITAAAACVGEPIPFTSSLSPFVTAVAFAWDFGDPTSGAANTSAGQAPAHRYQRSGSYTVTLRVTATDGRQFTTSQSVLVLPAPVVDLGPDLLICADETRLLSVGPQPLGTTYKWQDGSTAERLSTSTAGTYHVTVTGPSGCTSTDQIEVVLTDCPNLPNVITPNADQRNDAFVLKGLRAPEWSCQIFNRWGKRIYEAASYDNKWEAVGQPAGVYYYLLNNASTGQRLRGTLEVVR